MSPKSRRRPSTPDGAAQLPAPWLGSVASGHLWRGISRSDVKELGEIIDAGEVALVVVGTNRLEQTLDTQGFKAEKQIVKNVEVNGDELEEALRETVTEIQET